MALPEALIARFRTVAFERLERIDSTWTALTHGSAAPKADDEMFRELHTLKGDARVVGFSDVAVLCQKLEDLLADSRRRRYRVHDDVDVVVTMAIQFIGMLLRKKAGITRGIDLDGFLAQIEVVLAESLRRPSASVPQMASAPHLKIEASPRAPVASRGRLSAVATAVYLEHLRANGPSRRRLREAWSSLVREIAELDATPVAPALEAHVAAAKTLAANLGKSVDVVIEAGDLCVYSDALDALNTGILHAVRNAVDHGIDSPAERGRAGKPPVGQVRVLVRRFGDLIEVDVSDDGAGVDFESVKLKAAKLGRTPAEGALEELLFEPGFSTREQVTETSGRGVGLDAVRVAMARLGGDVRIDSVRGRGTTLRLSLMNRRAPVDVRVFRVPGAPVPFAVDMSWEIAPIRGTPVDPLALLDLPRTGGVVSPGTFSIHRDNRHYAFAAEGATTVAPATRLCAPPEGWGVEVVGLAEGEALLLNPEVLLGPEESR